MLENLVQLQCCTKRAKIAQARKKAVKINNAARLGTIESQINSTLADYLKLMMQLKNIKVI